MTLPRPVPIRSALAHLLVLGGLVLLLQGSLPSAIGQENSPLQQGIDAFQNGSYQKSIRLLRPIAEDDPTGQAYLFLGHAHYRLDQNRRARTMYGKAAERKITSSQIKPFLARIALDEGRPEKSLDLLRESLDADDVERTVVLRLYGRTLERMNQLDLAADAFRDALRTASSEQRPALLERLFFLHLDQDQGQVASQFANRLVDLQPLNHRYHLLKARAALAVDATRRAETSLEQARLLGGRSPDLFQTLADLHVKHSSYREAIYFYNRYREQTDSISPQMKYRLGLAYLQSGQYASARTYLFSAAREDSSYLNGVKRLIQTLYKRRGLDAALKQLDRFTSASSDETAESLQILRGRLYLNEDRYKEAFQAYRTLSDPETLDPQPLYNFALAALRSGHRDRALTLLKMGIALDPENKNFRSLLDEALSNG